MKIAFVSGSLRKDSFNTSLLREVETMLPAGVEAVWVNIDLPIYNGDLDVPGQVPEAAALLRAQIRDADAVLLSTPEYNYAIAGGVKNMIDWVSRPPVENFWRGKLVAVIGASPSFAGTARGQAMTKAAFMLVGARLFSGAEVLVATAHERFDASGRLHHAQTREVVEDFTSNLVAFVKHEQR